MNSADHEPSPTAGFPHFETYDRDDLSANLIRRARDGEVAALNELIRTWYTYLLHVANGEFETDLHGKLGASDIVQSACLEIQQHFHEFRGDSSAEWKAWLRQLLLRDMQDVRRKYRQAAKRDVQRERRLSDSSGFLCDPEDAEISARASLIAAEETNTLRAALQGLSEEHRLVLRLRNWDELSFAEIGCRLQRSEDAARKLWARAVEKLQLELDRTISE